LCCQIFDLQVWEVHGPETPIIGAINSGWTVHESLNESFICIPLDKKAGGLPIGIGQVLAEY
jgi:hypothetical protein